MKLVELVFREVNVVMLHSGVAVPAISLDRIRAARPAPSIQVTSGPAFLTVQYTDERMSVQIDPQRLTVSDVSTRGPEISPIVDILLAQHGAIGKPTCTAFGYNIRLDFRVEGIDNPGELLMRGTIRNPASVQSALRTDSFQAGLKLFFRKGLKLWTLHTEPMMGQPGRVFVHANIHEDLSQPEQPVPDESGPPAPAWLQGTSMGSGIPGAESMKADLALQSRTILETVVGILMLGQA
jgi:hypothetical protein